MALLATGSWRRNGTIFSGISGGGAACALVRLCRGRAATAGRPAWFEALESRRLLSLGTLALVEGPGAGVATDIVAAGGAWTASSNASWLHTTSSGTGNGLASFTFDANTGATRTGTLTIDGSALAVTQAGANYVAAAPVTALVSSFVQPYSVAVDGSGNVYFAASDTSTIEEWHASTGTVSTLISSGLNVPEGVALDASGNVYVADSGDNTIKEWHASTGAVTTLVSSGLNGPAAIAVDASGNVYIDDMGDDTIKEWNASTQTLTTLVSSGLCWAFGVAVDGSGNVYIADTGDGTIMEWHASTGTVTTLLAWQSYGVTVDGSGNLYMTGGSQTGSRSGTPPPRPSQPWSPPGLARARAWRSTPRATSTSPTPAARR